MPQIDARTFAKYAASPTEFVADLSVECDGSVKRYGEILADFQTRDFLRLCARCDGARTGARPTPPVWLRHIWNGLRVASKTTDIAALSVWMLAFAARPIKMAAFAADADQANLLRQAVETLIRLNPWLAEILTVEARAGVVNKAPAAPRRRFRP